MLLHVTENSPEPMRSQIARQLRARILTGDLQASSTLPDPRRIARELHVSPGDVRRALGELAQEGWLEPAAGASLRVAEVPAPRRRAAAQRRLLDDPDGQELLRRDLELAREVQRRLLPPARVDGEGFTVVSRSFPARVVAGDFHDVLPAADTVGVIVADVAGKGLAASLTMASVKAMTPFVAAGRGVAETLRELNRRLAGELGRAQFVALAFARITPCTGIVELANAGMPDPFLIGRDGAVRTLEARGPRLPLGIRPDVPYVSVTTRLADGERLFLFSDGIPEAPLASGGSFGYDALATTVGRGAADGGGVETWLDGVLDRVHDAVGPALDDDWTAVAVELRRRGER